MSLSFLICGIVINMFSKNDIVVILGSTKKDDCYSNFTFNLATVVAVGKYDLVVKNFSGLYKSDFVVSKSACQKIEFGKLKTHCTKKEPKINDLVLYTKRKYKSYKEDDLLFIGNGILIEIEDKPGESLMCKILNDKETITVPIKDVVVLEDVRGKR